MVPSLKMNSITEKTLVCREMINLATDYSMWFARSQNIFRVW